MTGLLRAAKAAKSEARQRRRRRAQASRQQSRRAPPPREKLLKMRDRRARGGARAARVTRADGLRAAFGQARRPAGLFLLIPCGAPTQRGLCMRLH